LKNFRIQAPNAKRSGFDQLFDMEISGQVNKVLINEATQLEGLTRDLLEVMIFVPAWS
jgi:hypothetical protein